jgi:hypothetical protein
MIKAVDHIVIVVHDLALARGDYEALGFTVVPGGEHAGGLTHNALVALADGAYLELVAFRQAPPADHIFYRPHGQEGLVAFALLPSDIEGDINAARARGLDVQGPVAGGRTRPDGARIEWRLGLSVGRDLPFLCADITPRDLRVPSGPACLHANRAQGVAAVVVVVNHTDAVARYSALLGTQPLPDWKQAEEAGQIARFKVGGTAIVLIRPEQGLAADYLHERGEGPYEVRLRASGVSEPVALDPARTHGARILLVPAA